MFANTNSQDGLPHFIEGGYGAGLLHGLLRVQSPAPPLIAGIASTDAETLVIEPERLSASIAADAQLGEHIMRALILLRLVKAAA
nr:XapX domain-containing protein [Paraburkholderia sp. BCC1886]